MGCGHYRIDLGVRHPRYPGAYVLGIECDGALYHSSATARDRDRLRQEVLEQSYGWKIHRVWGPDWLRARPREIERIRHALEKAIRQERAAPAAVEENPTPLGKKIMKPPADVKDAAARPPWMEIFVAADAERLGACVGHDLMKQPVSTLGKVIARIAEAENGVHFDRAADLILEANGIKRKGANIRDHFKRVKRALPQGFELESDFVYPPNYSPRVLVWDGTSERRELDTIPSKEIALAARKILESAESLPWDELVITLARLYGLQRVTQQNRDLLGRVLKAICDEGCLNNDAGRVTQV